MPTYTGGQTEAERQAAAEREQKRNALTAERTYLEGCKKTLSDLETQLKAKQKEATQRPEQEGEWEGSYFDFYERWMTTTLQSPYGRYVGTVSAALQSINGRIGAIGMELYRL